MGQFVKTAAKQCALVLLLLILATGCGSYSQEDFLHVGLNAVITRIDTENQVLTVKDPADEKIFLDGSFVRCEGCPVIYCNYDTQELKDIAFEDLQTGDSVLLQIRDSELQALKNCTDGPRRVSATQIQLGTQRLN